MGTRGRRSVAMILCIATTLGLLGFDTSPSHAQGDQTVTGTITDAIDGTPIAGISVTVSDYDGTTVNTLSAADGTYSAAGFQLFGLTLEAHDEYGVYAPVVDRDFGTSDGTIVHDLQLVRGGTITGHVTSETGDPISGVCVSVSRPFGYSPSFPSCTDADGAYATYGLPPDRYSLHFDAGTTGYVSEYYDDHVTRAASTDVDVVAGHAAVADAVLASGVRIAGTIRSEPDGTPVADALVRFSSRSAPFSRSARADSDGRYASPALPSDRYDVYVQPLDGIHLARYAGGTDDPSTAIAVTVGVDEVTVDVELIVGGAIEGTITDIDGAPVPGACVHLLPGASTCADANGVYRAGALVPGTYAMYASAEDFEDVQIDDIVVGSESIAHVDVTLPRLGVISGTVADSGDVHAPVMSGTVSVYRVGVRYPTASTTIGSDGSYLLDGLLPGDYIVVAIPDDSMSAATAYGGALTLDDATAVTVGLDQVVRDIDIELAPGAVMTGTVTSDVTGLPLDGACVLAQILDGFQKIAHVCTDASGHYEMFGLNPSIYRVYFVGPENGTDAYEPEHYSDVDGLGDPTPVEVSLDEPTVIDAALTPLAAVTGSVVDAVDGSPIAGVHIAFYGNPAPAGRGPVYTDDSGQFRAFIRPGTYTVVAEPWHYQHQYYSHADAVDGATPLTVTAAGIGGVDFELRRMGSLRGIVTSGGSPVSGVRIAVSRASEPDIVWSYEHSASDGSFAIELEPGTYVVRTVDTKSRYLDGWYSENPGSAVATPITIGDDPVAIDLDLTRGGAIEGTIADGVGQPRVVTIYPAAGGPVVASLSSSNDGTYVTPALPAGQYKVGANVPGGDAVFYGGDDLESAVILTVDAGSALRHIDLPTSLVVTNSVAGLDATGGDGHVSLAWSAPDPISSIVLGYRIDVSSDGGESWTAYRETTVISIVIDGLINGLTYRFRVTPLFASVAGRGSIVAATPRGRPGPPGTVTLGGAEGAVTANWSAPASDGGAPITDYAIERSADGGVTWASIAHAPSTSTTITTPVAAGTYVVRVAAVNAFGVGGMTPASNPAIVTEMASQSPIPPAAPPPRDVAPFVALPASARIMDTRADGITIDGRFQGGGRRSAGSVLALEVAGRAGLPDDSGSAVLNLTVVEAIADGYVTVYPCGVPRPFTASVNFSAGQTVANQIIAKIGSGGQVCVFTYADTDLVVDVSGELPADSAYTALPVPVRMLDTRTEPEGATVDARDVGGGRRGAGSVLALQVAGRGGVPIDATSVALNVVAVGPSAAGYITAYACGMPRPNAANLNVAAGPNSVNAVVSKVGVDGTVCIYTSAPTDLVVDVSGAFASTTTFEPLGTPARLVDTRRAPDGATLDGQMVGIGRRGAGNVLEVQVTGREGLPGQVQSVVLNVTAVSPSAAGYFTVFPCGASRPNTANLTYAAGQVVSNAVISAVGGGKVCIYTYAVTDLVVDVAGTVS